MSYKHRVYREDRSWWVDLLADDTTRTVTTYDESGAVVSTRPYDAAENAAADAAAADAAARAERETTRVAVKAIITDLQAEKARAQAVIDTANATINGSPASYVKDCARAAERISRAAMDLARFVADL